MNQASEFKYSCVDIPTECLKELITSCNRNRKRALTLAKKAMKDGDSDRATHHVLRLSMWVTCANELAKAVNRDA